MMNGRRSHGQVSTSTESNCPNSVASGVEGVCNESDVGFVGVASDTVKNDDILHVDGSAHSRDSHGHETVVAELDEESEVRDEVSARPHRKSKPFYSLFLPVVITFHLVGDGICYRLQSTTAQTPFRDELCIGVAQRRNAVEDVLHGES